MERRGGVGGAGVPLRVGRGNLEMEGSSRLRVAGT